MVLSSRAMQLHVMVRLYTCLDLHACQWMLSCKMLCVMNFMIIVWTLFFEFFYYLFLQLLD
jgi:hypothetical protein